MSCLFLSISDREPLWSLTFANIEAYCEKYGFDFHKLHHSLDESRHISWSKIPFLIDQMNRHPNYDFYVWIDDDMLITNFDVNIENIIKQYDFNNLLISKDPESIEEPINCGLMVFKHNKSTFVLLNKIYDMVEECGTRWAVNWEQDAFIKYYNEYMKNSKEIVATPYKMLQSFYRDNALSKKHIWQRRDFIAHFTGMTLENRIKYLQNIMTKYQC
jgi:hypothetical protein